jgi:hypothetical protein
LRHSAHWALRGQPRGARFGPVLDRSEVRNGVKYAPEMAVLDPFWGSYPRRWPTWPLQEDGAARQGIRGALRPRFPYTGSGGGLGVQVGNRPALKTSKGVQIGTPNCSPPGSRPQLEELRVGARRRVACHRWNTRCTSGWPRGAPLYIFRVSAFHQSGIAQSYSPRINPRGVQIRGRDPDPTSPKWTIWGGPAGPHPGHAKDGQWELHVVCPGGHHCVYYVPRMLPILG